MELYLIRHTAPEVPAGVCYGRAELDLSDSFARDLAAVRAKLAGIAAAVCYSSPSLRCARLAEQLGPGRPQYDPRLLELDFGAWEMQPWDAIPRQELDRWSQSYVDTAPPGGETFRSLHRRAGEFLRERIEECRAEPVVAVTHAGVIRALLADALDSPLQETFRISLDYGGVTQLLTRQGRVSVGWVNR